MLRLTVVKQELLNHSNLMPASHYAAMRRVCANTVLNPDALCKDSKEARP